MITIIYFILTFLGVLPFTWWVPFIDGIVETFIVGGLQDDTTAPGIVSSYITVGIIFFSFYKLFCSLTLHPVFILLTGIVVLITFFVPGGFTIFNLLLVHFGYIFLPTWVLILGIVADVLTLVLVLYVFLPSRR